MEPLKPVVEGHVSRRGNAPAARGHELLGPVGASSNAATPASPPPDVLDALDRAARVMSELGRKNVTVALEHTTGSRIRIMVRHPGAPAEQEISQRSLLSLLDDDTSEVGGLVQ